MTPESRNGEVRIDVHCQATTRKTYSRGNEYASNNRVISVAMQRRCKHAFPTTGWLCFLRGPCTVISRSRNVTLTLRRTELSLETPACQDTSLGTAGDRIERVGRPR
jgi:hypothetical protein